MTPRRIDLTGQRFGALVAIMPGQRINNRTFWICECDCGNTITKEMENLKRAHPNGSCGCIHRGNYSHGYTIGGVSSIYGIWCAMKRRCFNPACEDWIDYGYRGITVCERWMKFENFLADMGEKPEGKSLDRIDVNGNYELSNCHWATPKEQRHNRRDTTGG